MFLDGHYLESVMPALSPNSNAGVADRLLLIFAATTSRTSAYPELRHGSQRGWLQLRRAEFKAVETAPAAFRLRSR